MLIEKGVDPARYFKDIFFAGSHDKMIGAVVERQADASAIYDGSLVKHLLGFTKVRYRGLYKNTVRALTMFALSNL